MGKLKIIYPPGCREMAIIDIDYNKPLSEVYCILTTRFPHSETLSLDNDLSFRERYLKCREFNLKHSNQLCIIDYEKYYPMFYKSFVARTFRPYNSKCADDIPYIFVNDKLAEHLRIYSVSIEDFLDSFENGKSTLFISVFHNTAGIRCCPVPTLPAITFEQLYDVLQIIATATTVGGSAIGLAKWLHEKWNKMRSEDIPPCSITNVMDVLLCKSEWSRDALADILNLPPDIAKDLLLGFGYKYDKTQRVYRKTPKTYEIIKSLDMAIEEKRRQTRIGKIKKRKLRDFEHQK